MDDNKHMLQPFWDLSVASIQSKALDIALQHAIFDRLIEPHTINVIANWCGYTPERCEVWLELLWSMGCLQRSSEKTDSKCYMNTALGNRYLTQDSKNSCINSLKFRYQTLQSTANMLPELLSGKDIPTPNKNLWARAAKYQIAEEQQNIAVPALANIWSSLPKLADDITFLDVGGGPGFISHFIADYYPNSHGVIFDLPNTTQVAQDNIISAELSSRLTIQKGDLNKEDPTGQYDLILCSNVLHFMQYPEDIIKRLAQHLTPNGILLCAHAETSDNAKDAAQVNPYFFPMMMSGAYLPKTGEIPKMMTNENLTHLSSISLTATTMTPLWLHCARKL